MNKVKYSIIAKNPDHGLMKIFVRCELFDRFEDVDTKVRVFIDEWDEEYGMVINNPNAKQLNVMIRKTLYELEELELNYDGNFTLDKLLEIYINKDSMHDFYSMMEYQIGIRKLRSGTKGIQINVLKKLRQFSPECRICDLTESFMNKYIDFMESENYSKSTIKMHIQVIKCYYGIASKLFGNKVPAGTFENLKTPRELTFKIKPFTDEDIRMIENYVARQDSPKMLVETLDRFLFMAYTGCRISDFRSLSADNFKYENNVLWLTYTSIKTDTFVRVPLTYIFNGRAEQLYNKYIKNLDYFFNVTNLSYNTRLKTAAKKVGINKPISSHVARHTYATRLINKDVPVTTIQKLIGHKCIEMTMMYAKINENTIIRQVI